MKVTKLSPEDDLTGVKIWSEHLKTRHCQSDRPSKPKAKDSAYYAKKAKEMAETEKVFCCRSVS